VDRAYIFPFGVSIEKGSLHLATPVGLSTDYNQLFAARNHERLRCPYGGCLEPVKLVHESAGSHRLSHFAHFARTPASPPCPYRSESSGEGGGGPGGAAFHNIRKLIENALQFELQRKLANRPGVRITSSKYDEREPQIKIEGLERPVLIKALMPGVEALWKQPYSGEFEGAQVLFFAANVDVPQLRDHSINEKLLSVRPGIVVYYEASDREDHRYKVVSQISPSRDALPTGAPLNTIDLIYLDYAALWKMRRAPEFLFISTEHKDALEYITGKLAALDKDSPQSSLLRILAKRLVVDGTLNHSAFGQTYAESKQCFKAASAFHADKQVIQPGEYFRLARDSLISEMTKEQPLIARLLESLHNEALTAADALSSDLERAIKSARELEVKLEATGAELRAKEAALAEQARRSESEQGRLIEQFKTASEALENERRLRGEETKQLASRLSQKETEFSAQKEEAGRLRRDLDKLRNHWFLGRLSRLIEPGSE
jgi:hypothetical protein